jgi:microcystin-dependent protein
MKKESAEKEKRKLVFNKTNVMFLTIGFLAAVLLATASILIFCHLQENTDGEDDLLLGAPPNLGGTLMPVVTDFDSEVTKSSEPVLLLIVSEGTSMPEMSTMTESVGTQWEYELKQYEVGSDTENLQKLGIESSELPVFAFMYKGKLLGKQRILQIVKDSEVISWASDIVSEKVNVPVIYKTFPDSYTIKNAYLPDEYATGELSLFPYPWSVEGYRECVDGSSLKASEHTKLYELLGKPALDNSGTFSLPNYPSIITPARDHIRYFINLEGDIPRENPDFSVSSVNGITYIEHPIDSHGYLNRDYYIGEIVLGKFLDEDDLRLMQLMPCDGKTLNINSYQALFALIGTTYGGNGMHNFAVPDLSKAESPIEGAKYYIFHRGIFPARVRD